jgi:hypothetical protein
MLFGTGFWQWELSTHRLQYHQHSLEKWAVDGHEPHFHFSRKAPHLQGFAGVRGRVLL